MKQRLWQWSAPGGEYMRLQEDMQKDVKALVSVTPGASEQGTAAGRSRSLAQDAVLRGGQLLDQAPEVAEGDALSGAHAHFTQDL